jgi:hypothetical protein
MPRIREPTFRLKTIIWDVAAKTGKSKLQAIQRQLDYELEKLRTEGEISEDTPDIRTIRRIIEKDINNLTLEVVVSRLPEHVWCLRADYETLKQLAEKTDQALTRETDPLVTKAQEEHLTEVRGLIEEWLQALRVQEPLTIDDVIEGCFGLNNLPCELNRVTSKTVFGCLKEHLAQAFWDGYCAWEGTFSEYVEACRDFLAYIKKKRQAWPNVRQFSSGFEGLVLSQLADQQLRLRLDARESDEFPPYTLGLGCRGKWLEGWLEEAGKKVGDNKLILEAQHPEEYVEMYRNPTTMLLSGEEAARLARLRNEISDRVFQIQYFLEKSLIKRSYIMHRCSMCPAGPSPV